MQEKPKEIPYMYNSGSYYIIGVSTLHSSSVTDKCMDRQLYTHSAR